MELDWKVITGYFVASSSLSLSMVGVSRHDLVGLARIEHLHILGIER